MLPINDKTSDRIIFGLIEIGIILFIYYSISTTVHKDGAFHDHYELLSHRSKIATIYLACSLTFSNYCSYKWGDKVKQKYSCKVLFLDRLYIAIITFMISIMIIMPCLDFLVQLFF